MWLKLLKRVFNASVLLMLGVYFLQKKARKLNQTEVRLLASYFESSLLKNAAVVEGVVPFWLHKKMAGVVVRHIVFLRKPLVLNHLQLHDSKLVISEEVLQYHPQVYLNDIEILAHELVHVAQFSKGMTIFKYIWASRHGYTQNPYELEAYAKAAQIKHAYQQSLFKKVSTK